MDAKRVASISRCCSIVKNCTPYTSSSMSSFRVSGVSQKTLLGPSEMLFPLTVSSKMLWMAGSAVSSGLKKVTHTVRESGTSG